MKSGFKKWIGLALPACLALVVAMSGCSKTGDTTGASGNGNSAAPAGAKQEDKYDKLPKDVSISMFDRGQVSSDEGTYEENRWVKWIREQSGINLKVVPVPRNQAQEKLNVLVASNQAPDLIWEYDRNYIGNLVTQGVIQPIDEYIDKYSTSYKKYLQENPDLKPYISFDGKIYAMTTKRTISTIANHGIWIRQDWLDKLGLKTPTTMDELIAVAQAFKDNDPDGNGKADTVPIVGYTFGDVISAMFGAVWADWYLEDGKMKYGPTLDRYGDALATEKKMYDLGLLDKELFTDKDNSRTKQLWTTGKAGICMCQWGGGTVQVMNRDLMTNNPNALLAPLEPVSTKYGKYGTYQETPAFIYVTFNKNMKNPKAAIQYLDWIMDKGWFSLNFGTEGTHYKLVNGIPQKTDNDKFKKEVLYASEYGVLRPLIEKAEDWPIKAAQDPLSQKIANLEVKSLNTVLKNKFRRDIPYQPNVIEINEAKASIRKTIDEIRAKTVTQSGYTAEKALEDLRKEWKRLGGDKAEQLAQEWYEKNKSNFK
ncbi:extracellular solute-binding protein [Paenibacillus sedimenti]|uniref:Extracellular solute-binding protein n=1 Tax=Paenibacillus sedimenti TaxID=2770274 RepID=A0A926KT28_9BACL|nr:extracellular solute-binding protein [Paenibacillus sedimenti]MBD0381500.1 extracellular solute-binding protein [Paenibacillus sedimenti]